MIWGLQEQAVPLHLSEGFSEGSHVAVVTAHLDGCERGVFIGVGLWVIVIT